MTEDFALPEGFLFGASTSPHQVEGNNLASDWWAFENAPDTFLPDRSGDACDSFERWRDDMDLLRSLGFTSYRFGVEWARVEPERDAWSRSAILHYARMVSYARSIGLEPVVTLHHFTHPLWFRRDGGWQAPDAIERFVRYIDAIAEVIDAGVRTVVTINEPNMLAIMQVVARSGAGLAGVAEHGLPAPDASTADRLAQAHHAAVAHLRRRHPGVRVGWSIASQVVQAVPGGEALADAYRESREDRFLRESVHDDFVGVQSYTRTVFGPDGVIPPAPDAERTANGWEFYPEAVGHALRHSAAVIGGIPLIVTENGIATTDDDRRIAYTQGALQSVADAIRDGVDVRGYLHWSALDNYEWGNWHAPFGLIAFDPHTFERTPKPSAHWLGAIARAGRIPVFEAAPA